MITDQMALAALEAARNGRIEVLVPERKPEFSLFYEGGMSPIHMRPPPPRFLLGPMPLEIFADWVDRLIEENKVQKEKIKAFEQIVFQAGRALGSMESQR